MGAAAGNRAIWSQILLFAVCFILPLSSSAQIRFEKRLGSWLEEDGYSVRQTQDGGYAVGGSILSVADGLDAYLVKTDSLGAMVWDATFGGAGDDQASSLWQTSDRGYVLAGYTESFGAGESDLYLVKTDSLGNMIWDIACGGPDHDEGYSVQETSDGGLVVAGATSSFGAGAADVYVIKVDSLGSIRWQRTYGGASSDVGYSVQETQDGGYVIAGHTRSSGSGDVDVYLVKIDSLGDLLWDRSYGGSGRDEGMSVQLTADGGYIIAGYTESLTAGTEDVYLIKTDTLGNTLWHATHGGAGNDRGRSVDKTLCGGYIIAGTTEQRSSDGDNVFLVKTDSLGQMFWTRTFDGMRGAFDGAEGRSVQQTTDGGYIIAGGIGHWMEADIFLIKTDGNGLTEIVEGLSTIVLSQNYPNPFRHLTLISFSLPQAIRVTVAVYDITGRLVETLVNETRRPGIHEIHWDRMSNPSGVYFYRLEAGKFKDTRKMLVID